MKSGFLNILKPPGMTSHNVVAFVRHLAGKKAKVGHLGTLDPGAAGVLALAIGQATRLIDYLPAARKKYIAEAVFGFETHTLDCEGEITSRCGPGVADITAESVKAACCKLSGDIMQVPPNMSALHLNGQRCYDLVRKGCDFSLPPRPVTIHQLEMTQFYENGEFEPCLPDYAGGAGKADGLCGMRLEVECSQGTYIRSLIRDIGYELGNLATMTFLLRTSSGVFDIAEALPLEDVRQRGLDSVIIPMPDVLERCGASRLQCPQGAVRGYEFRASVPDGLVSLECNGKFCGIGLAANGKVKVERALLEE